MSFQAQVARTEEAPRLFTIEGLASSFDVSVETIRKYITYGLVDYARGRNHDGFNYDYNHYLQIAAVRRERERAKPLNRRKRQHAHCITLVAQGALA